MSIFLFDILWVANTTFPQKLDTDFAFQAMRRNWTISMSKSGIDVYGYEFTDPDAVFPLLSVLTVAPGSLGGTDSIAVLLFPAFIS